MPYGWPEYEILLQRKITEAKYIPIELPKASKEILWYMFYPPHAVPIKLVKNSTSNAWGLKIADNAALEDSYMYFMKPMFNYFLSCLGTLNDAELKTLKNVFAYPALKDATFSNDETAKIDNKLASNLRRNQCGGKKRDVPAWLTYNVDRSLEKILTLENFEEQPLDPEILRFALIFNQFIFSFDGLWMLVTMQEIKNYVTRVMENFPEIKNEGLKINNFNSFLDFIDTNFRISGLSNEQYKLILWALNINKGSQLLDEFLFKDYMQSNKLKMANISVNTKSSTYFFRGE